MSWSALTPTAAEYGAHARFLVEYFDLYNAMRSAAQLAVADSINGIFLSEAKAEVLRDLQIALALNPDDADDLAVINDLCDATKAGHQRTRLRFAVALQQLVLAFRDASSGEESENARAAARFESRYAKERAGFAGLRRRVGNGSRITRIGL